jgi:malate/lactate dehydrogenase
MGRFAGKKTDLFRVQLRATSHYGTDTMKKSDLRKRIVVDTNPANATVRF